MAEIGEYVAGAYLRLCEECDVVDYNARSPKRGMEGMGEIDVIGLRFSDNTAFLCEVATHLDGLNYGASYTDTADRILAKHERAKAYAAETLKPFTTARFMLWSPRVPRGALSACLEASELELIINETYTRCVEELRSRARTSSKDIGNPFFRSLQILEHLRRIDG